MKMLTVIAIFAVSFAGAQAPPPKPPAAKSAAKPPAITRIGKHQVGETLPQWLAAENASSSEDFCLHQSSQTEVGLCREDVATIESGGKWTVSSHEGTTNDYLWGFSGQKVVQLVISIRRDKDGNDPDVRQEIKYLTEAYGPPSRDQMAKVQNAFGATWEERQVSWSMPDIDIVAGTDTPNHSFVVVFVPKAKPTDQKPNPYTH